MVFFSITFELDFGVGNARGVSLSISNSTSRDIAPLCTNILSYPILSYLCIIKSMHKAIFIRTQHKAAIKSLCAVAKGCPSLVRYKYSTSQQTKEQNKVPTSFDKLSHKRTS
mmetsp:Transcript_19448/g.24778  ORF Transcript_19448/g.24778 Transcript_19448/m.24778 type:complete len:112 (+) Transcript_19448:1206-1541(+)